MEQAVSLYENGAQASDDAWGWGSPRALSADGRRATVFPACGIGFSMRMLCIENAQFRNDPDESRATSKRMRFGPNVEVL
jgi:hypothetical protein